MSNVLGVRNRPGLVGNGNVAGNAALELQDYRVSPTCSKITYWIFCPAAARLDVFRWDPSMGASGVPGGTKTLQSFLLAGDPNGETPVRLDDELAGAGLILRAVLTDTSGNPQNGIFARVGERRFSH